jgi:hypothetical protein
MISRRVDAHDRFLERARPRAGFFFAQVLFCKGPSLPTQEPKNSDVVSSEGSGQSATFADEKAIFCQTSSRHSITLLPSGIDTPRREISLKFHGLDEPPPARAFVSWEIGSGLVLRESVEIRTPALKEMDALAHRSLLLRRSGQLWQRIRSSHLAHRAENRIH